MKSEKATLEQAISASSSGSQKEEPGGLGESEDKGALKELSPEKIELKQTISPSSSGPQKDVPSNVPTETVPKYKNELYKLREENTNEKATSEGSTNKKNQIR